MDGIRLISLSSLPSINSIAFEGGASLPKYPYARAKPAVIPNK